MLATHGHASVFAGLHVSMSTWAYDVGMQVPSLLSLVDSQTDDRLKLYL